ncbi:MAG: hypothetical protein JWN72_1600 [Thermoleophilia bacterium]|nr:hypothetical protein [Thermoleophilia bacterium]
MQLIATTAPATSTALPARVQDLTGTSLTVVSDFGNPLTSLMPGTAVLDGRSPGAGALAAPRFDVIAGSFEDALRAARELSAQAPLGAGSARGYQPVAIVQAADGTRAITPLLTPQGSWMFMAAENGSVPYRYSRGVEALVAVVSAGRTLDMRTIPVGGRL